MTHQCLRTMLLGAGLWAVMGSVALALELPSNAEMVRDENAETGDYDVAIGAWHDGVPTQTAEGAVSRQVWRIPTRDPNTLQILGPLRQQLLDDGATVAFECRAEQCGGFDFRFGIDLAKAPDIYVDLSDFRYLAARKDDVWTTVFVSRANEAGYVQIVQVLPEGAEVAEVAATAAPLTAPQPVATTTLGQALDSVGHAVLNGVEFSSGSDQLIGTDWPALDELVAYLTANPDLTVALVGHTDASGALAGNIALSKRRAGTVMGILRDRGIAAGRMEAEGMGYLAPIATNRTQEGRDENRRVEVIVTSVQ